MEINGYLIVPAADLTGAKLSVFELRDKDLRRITFKDADLSDTNFNGSNLAETLFWRANLRFTNFTNANLSSTSFWEANLEGAVLVNTTIGSTTGKGGDEYTDFINANLRGADLSVNDWSGFEPINMSNANLTSEISVVCRAIYHLSSHYYRTIHSTLLLLLLWKVRGLLLDSTSELVINSLSIFI